MFRNFLYFPTLEHIIDKHFPGDQRIPLEELEKNTSLAFLSGHPLMMDNLRPTAPNVKYVGLLNCHPPRKLPEELSKVMSNAEGVIYFSLGSIYVASEMHNTTLRIFANVFRRLSQQVIWKWELDYMQDKPDNVHLAKWLPQQDILGHPNTRLFITHAGMNSMQEAICHKTPVVS